MNNNKSFTDLVKKLIEASEKNRSRPVKADSTVPPSENVVRVIKDDLKPVTSVLEKTNQILESTSEEIELIRKQLEILNNKNTTGKESIKQTVTGKAAGIDIKPVITSIDNSNKILQKILEETTLTRKLSEGSLEYDKESAQYRNTSGRELESKVSGKAIKKGGYVDFESAADRLTGQGKRVRESESNVLDLKTVDTRQSRIQRSPTPRIKIERPQDQENGILGKYSGLGTLGDLGRGIKSRFGEIKDFVTNKNVKSDETVEDIPSRSSFPLLNNSEDIGKGIKESFISSKEPPASLPAPVDDEAKTENDNFLSANEIMADNSKLMLESSGKQTEILEKQLGELQKIREALTGGAPNTGDTSQPQAKRAEPAVEPASDDGGLELPGLGSAGSLGKKILGGAKSLGKGALKLGTSALKFAGTNAGMVAGSALAIGAGAYTAYKGYTGAEEEKQQQLQAVEQAVQKGELSPEEAEAKKKEIGETTVEKKGGAIGEGTGMAAGGIAGAKLGAAAGAAIGSVIPIAGTAIGAGVGALAGGALGAFAGSKAGKVVGEYGGKAINATGKFFSGLGDKAKAAFGQVKDSWNRGTGGTMAAQEMDAEVLKRTEAEGVEFGSKRANEIRDEVRKEILAKDPNAFRLADQRVSSSGSVSEKETAGQGMVTTDQSTAEGITSKKSLFGSEFLGSLVSKKGLQTGTFSGTSSKQKSIESTSDSMMSSTDNTTSEFKELFGERISGGLFGKDKYRVSTGDGINTEISKDQYMKMQALVAKGDPESQKQASAMLEDIRKKSAEAKMFEGAYDITKSPEETVTPITKPSNTGSIVSATSTENTDLNRSMTQSRASSTPVVSNNVVSNNSTSFVPIKPTPRPEYTGSALDRYQNRVAAY